MAHKPRRDLALLSAQVPPDVPSHLVVFPGTDSSAEMQAEQEPASRHGWSFPSGRAMFEHLLLPRAPSALSAFHPSQQQLSLCSWTFVLPISTFPLQLLGQFLPHFMCIPGLRCCDGLGTLHRLQHHTHPLSVRQNVLANVTTSP